MYATRNRRPIDKSFDQPTPNLYNWPRHNFASSRGQRLQAAACDRGAADEVRVRD